MSLLPRSVEKRPGRLRLEIEIKWHSKCNRLYHCTWIWMNRLYHSIWMTGVTLSRNVFLNANILSLNAITMLPLYGVATTSRLLKITCLFYKEPHKRHDILQKRPVILRSLLFVATPYLNLNYWSYLVKERLSECKYPLFECNRAQTTDVWFIGGKKSVYISENIKHDCWRQSAY